ncbi:MAG: hypothetical protein ACXWNJ_06020 [Vulcanimicrobiaceae bacterium]
MTDTGLPPLVLALAAAASSQLRLEEDEPQLRGGFVPAIAVMDEADLAYRRTIKETLQPEAAGAMLSAIAAFREKVREVRERTQREIGELYRRYSRSYGWFDPLDPYTPPAAGLTHADGTRVATISDSARSAVDSMRTQVNEAVAKRLLPAQIDALLVAKRRRRDAFETALKRALEMTVSAHSTVTASEIDKTAYQLMQLADGWY